MINGEATGEASVVEVVSPDPPDEKSDGGDESPCIHSTPHAANRILRGTAVPILLWGLLVCVALLEMLVV